MKKTAKLLRHLANADHTMRKGFLSGKSVWDEKMDTLHTAQLKKIINKIGWPTISKVGKQASKSAWLIAQHSDHDIDFQEKCLAFLMENSTDIESWQIDFLEDRILFSKGLPQKHNTQSTTKLPPTPASGGEHLHLPLSL